MTELIEICRKCNGKQHCCINDKDQPKCLEVAVWERFKAEPKEDVKE
jgi:hypothetical protein